MNTKYPIVSKEEVIDLFHFFLYWLCLGKQASWLNPCYWFTSFELFSKVVEQSVIPARRLVVLGDNREFFRMFIAKVLVLQYTDDRTYEIALGAEKNRPFAVKITPREQVNGNTVDARDLFARRKIFITARGMATGSIAEKAVARLVTRADFEKVWAEITAKPIPGFVHGLRNRGYSDWLESDEGSDHP